jgi:hypothetical protein
MSAHCSLAQTFRALIGAYSTDAKMSGRIFKKQLTKQSKGDIITLTL